MQTSRVLCGGVLLAKNRLSSYFGKISSSLPVTFSTHFYGEGGD